MKKMFFLYVLVLLSSNLILAMDYKQKQVRLQDLIKKENKKRQLGALLFNPKDPSNDMEKIWYNSSDVEGVKKAAPGDALFSLITMADSYGDNVIETCESLLKNGEDPNIAQDFNGLKTPLELAKERKEELKEKIKQLKEKNLTEEIEKEKKKLKIYRDLIKLLISYGAQDK